MNNLCADIGYKSINHFGEQLCGDHIEIVENNGTGVVVVLADGLGSGVKASILSTITSKIISTTLSQGLSLEECVSAIAASLPVCSVRNVAYSTFTIIHLLEDDYAEIIQYDNPKVVIFRDGESYDYETDEIVIGEKTILKSRVALKEKDIILAMSDGCTHAGMGKSFNFGWTRKDIIKFMAPYTKIGHTAKTLSTLLSNECNRLYEGKPGDDATACVIRMRNRVPVNLLFGPPSNKDDCGRMMSLFFSKEGKHIVCGGTTASIAAAFLNKPLKASLDYVSDDLPPVGTVEGIDLVTEGVITINKVLVYAKDYIKDNKEYSRWGVKNDGASLICRLLFEEATDINFYVGRAINPAHQNPDLPINFSIKMNLVKELSDCLKRMGKRVKVNYF